ncbi:3-oxoacyl-ACP reductase [Massilia sp. S19_KUP03_FR1]|uniref:3-oxoacyl-ACP reductase n=1 Tax=Massilia sp. S19_KUP03_FR1 TaxID=3025503 RepID=UPI002FCD7852
MRDGLVRLHENIFTRHLVRALGLPKPVALARAAGGYTAQPFAGLRVLTAQAPGGYALGALDAALAAAGAAPARLHLADAVADTSPVDIFVLDATACTSVDATRLLYAAFHPLMRRLALNGRVLIAAADPGAAGDPVAAALARGIEGFVRSLAKELGPRGITVNLVYVAPDALERLAGPVRFFCGIATTYVTGQALHLARGVGAEAAPLRQALAGKVALVTGAARGIGVAIAQRLQEEGARVVALDVPAAATVLHAACSRFNFTPLVLDIAEAGAAHQISAFLRAQCGGVDIVVHNAGVTRDRRLANMKAPYWDLVMEINFGAVAALDHALLDGAVLRDGGRIVCLASISGIAGNVGQSNYALSKAALIGYVAAQAPRLAARAICINAVAPGFIETPMTDAMPFMLRELGRRANSLKQGGQPRDVAELVTFLATPGAGGISGQTVRVCGQALIGA